MSFLYPRTATVTRPAATSGKGDIGYQGLNPSAETTVLSNIPCSIQQVKYTRKLDTSLPSDITRGTEWNIYFPAEAVSNGTILDRDIITDDLSIRYQVIAAYWNSLGYRLACERLEA